MTDAIPVDIPDWSGSSPDQAATWSFAGDGPLGSWDAALTGGIDHAAPSDGILFPIDPSALHHGSAALPGSHPAQTTAPQAAPHGDAHGSSEEAEHCP